MQMVRSLLADAANGPARGLSFACTGAHTRGNVRVCVCGCACGCMGGRERGGSRVGGWLHVPGCMCVGEKYSQGQGYCVRMR